MISGEEHLQELISKVLEHAGVSKDAPSIDNWIISPYTPTPTIIEAARALYENHSVEDITRHEADKVSTDRTINYILQVIEQSKAQKKKSICFVTGVPGAGKTLVGLDVAIKQTYKDGELDKENGAVYLSGNGPLVAVLTETLAQREDWAVIVCLVGGGQEINTGEAGITEWIKALNTMFKHWDVYISNKLTDAEYAEGRVNELLQDNKRVTFAEDLHLAVSLRSFRAETLSAFVQSMLAFSSDAAELYKDVAGRNYPIVLTRDMDTARAWLRKQARGTQQTGILVTKVAARFKPLAVHILAQDEDNAVHWFLEDKTDIRSSNYLEDAATEIQVQGLELDYACVLWDADMRYEDGIWNFYKFNGKNKWNPENNKENQKYMLNAYRVLLTRARQGIIICIPKGNNRLTPEGFPEDPTRLPEFYDGTYKYLKGLGIKEL